MQIPRSAGADMFLLAILVVTCRAHNNDKLVQHPSQVGENTAVASSPFATSKCLLQSSRGLHTIQAPATVENVETRDTASNMQHAVLAGSVTLVATATLGGAMIGVVVGLVLIPIMPYGSLIMIGCSGLVGAAAGGTMGLMAETGLLPADAEMSMKELLGFAPDNSTIFDEPLMEKLRYFALEIINIDRYEAEHAMTEEEKKAYQKDMAQAMFAFEHIKQLEQSGLYEVSEEKRHEVEKDFQNLEEVLSHGDTAGFISAETSKKNQAVLTEHDVATIEGHRAEEANGNSTFQGDMITAEDLKSMDLSLSQRIDKANQSHIGAGPPWENGVVQYCVAPDVSKHVVHLLEAALKWYRDAIPCLSFVDVGHQSGTSTSPVRDQKCKAEPAVFVQSDPNQGCYSYVGMVDSLHSQRLQIQDPGCLCIGTVLHEVAHALGMGHEQSRPDRDSYVKIHWNNIISGKQSTLQQHNFDIYDKTYDDNEYDKLSIMHYDNYAFSKDKSKYTIEELPLGGSHDTLGQRAGLSSLDVSQLALMYQCKSTALDGEGCIDIPDDTGKDMCSGITQCTGDTVEKCCACGGGTKVQCYKNKDCPRVKRLPLEDLTGCFKDLTYMFAGSGHKCIYQNICDFNVAFSCKGLPCKHTSKSKKASASFCQDERGQNQVQTKICSAISECTLWKE